MADKKNDVGGAAQTALRNQVVLRQIFCYLCVKDLKQCRRVNTTWNIEAHSFMKDFHQCYLKVSDSSMCSSLYRLNELISEVNLDYINSLRITFEPENHWDCQYRENSEPHIYNQLLQNLEIKHLYISGQTFDGQLECPTKKFVVALLREKINKLHTLIFIDFPEDFQDYFDADWDPYLPNLKTLRMGLLKRVYPSSVWWDTHKDFFLKIISGAPNLKTLQAYFDTDMLDALPEEKYALLSNFMMCIPHDYDEERFRELVAARPSLRRLSLNSGYGDNPLCSDVLDQLMSSSCKTLEKLKWCPNVPFNPSQRTFPVLRKLAIFTETWGNQLVNLLKSIDYPRTLPALHKLEIHCCPGDHAAAESGLNPRGSIEAALEDLRPSTTLKDLRLRVYHNRTTFQDYSKILPNVTELDVWPKYMHRRSIYYTDLWASCWSQLEKIRLIESFDAWEDNFDADFLGVYPAEVDLLRELDDASLQTLHVVPVRPSILTMQKLKSLEIVLSVAVGRAGQIHPERVFLSKVMGFLAFKSLLWKGVTVKLAGGQHVQRLQHLKPFAAL